MGNCASCKHMQKGKHEAGGSTAPMVQDENAQHEAAVPGTKKAHRCKIAGTVVGENGMIAACRCESAAVAALEVKGETVHEAEACRREITGAAGEEKDYRPLHFFLAEEQHKAEHPLQEVERAKDEKATATLPPLEIMEQVEQKIETKEKPLEKVESEAIIAHEPIPAAESVAPPSAEKLFAAVAEEASGEKLLTDTVIAHSVAAATATAALVQQEVERHVEKFEPAVTNPVKRVESETRANVDEDVPETTIAQQQITDLEKIAPEKFTMAVVEEAQIEKLATVDTVAESSVAVAGTPVLEQLEDEQLVLKFEAALASEVLTVAGDPVESLESETTAKIAIDVPETTIPHKRIAAAEKVAPPPAEKFIAAAAEEDQIEPSVAVAKETPVFEQSGEEQLRVKFEAAVKEVLTAAADPVGRCELENPANVVADVSETTIPHKPIATAEKVAPPLAEKFIAAAVEEANTEMFLTVDTVVGTSLAAATTTAVLEQPEEERHVEKFEAAATSVSEMPAAVADPVERVELETTANGVADVSETAQILIPNLEKIAQPSAEKSTIAVEEASDSEILPVDMVVEPRLAAATATQVLEKQDETQHVEKFEAAETSEISSAVGGPVERVESDVTAAEVPEIAVAHKLIPLLDELASKPAEEFIASVVEETDLVPVETVVGSCPVVAAATPVLEQQHLEQHVEKLKAASDSDILDAVTDPVERVESEATTVVVAEVSEITVAHKLITDLEKVALEPAEKFIAEVVEETETSAASGAVADPVPKEGDGTESGAGTIDNGGKSV